MKPRWYQQRIYEVAKHANTLVVLPTGAGKTFIAFLLARDYLARGKVVMLAPTKPLCLQHQKFFAKNGLKGVVITGEVPRERRKELWRNELCFATPQTLERDILAGLITPKEFSLIIFDEAHRAIGKYSYVFIASVFEGRVLALTASPAATQEKLEEIMRNLKIEKVMFYDEKDLRGYIPYKRIERVFIELPEKILKLKKALERAMAEVLLTLREKGYKVESKRKALLELQKMLVEERKFELLPSVSAAIKLSYALELLQTQGVKPTFEFLRKIKEDRKTKANRLLTGQATFNKAYSLCMELLDQGIEHPKFTKLVDIIRKELKEGIRIIVFTQFTRTAERIYEFIKEVERCRPVLFFGKRKLGQKKQKEVIELFRDGYYNVMVATSIAEEGLHIENADVGIFFEPVPSALRMVQRRGRIGRINFGKIYLLIARKTIDEAYYWSAYHKEKRMKELLNSFKQARLCDLK